MSKLIQNFLSNRVLSRFTIFALDILMILFSCLSIYYVKYGFTGLTQEVRSDGMTLCLLLILFNTVTFISFRTFRGILRFSSFSDLLRIIYALVLGYVLAFVAVTILNRSTANFYITNVVFTAIFFFRVYW